MILEMHFSGTVLTKRDVEKVRSGARDGTA
jgi:hypothetical protein